MAFGDEIQSAANASGGTTSLTVDGNNGWSTPTSGNLLVLQTARDDGATIDTVPDGFAEAVAGESSITGNAVYWKISEGDETTFTVTTLSSEEQTLIVAEIEGPFEASPVGVTQSNENTNSSATTGSTGTTAETSQADKFILAAFATQDGDVIDTDIPTFSNDFVGIDFTRGGTALGDTGAALAGKVVSATGTQECTATWQNGSGSRSHNVIATFKGSGGAPPPAAAVRRNLMTMGVGR